MTPDSSQVAAYVVWDAWDGRKFGPFDTEAEAVAWAERQTWTSRRAPGYALRPIYKAS